MAQYKPKDLTQIDAKIINNLSMVSEREKVGCISIVLADQRVSKSTTRFSRSQVFLGKLVSEMGISTSAFQ